MCFRVASGACERGDYIVAVLGFRPWVEQGDAFAQFSLGIMYAQGRSVPMDWVQAHAWFNLAAAQGDENAIVLRDYLQADMTSEQVLEARRMARELANRFGQLNW